MKADDQQIKLLDWSLGEGFEHQEVTNFWHHLLMTHRIKTLDLMVFLHRDYTYVMSFIDKNQMIGERVTSDQKWPLPKFYMLLISFVGILPEHIWPLLIPERYPFTADPFVQRKDFWPLAKLDPEIEKKFSEVLQKHSI